MSRRNSAELRTLGFSSVGLPTSFVLLHLPFVYFKGHKKHRADGGRNPHFLLSGGSRASLWKALLSCSEIYRRSPPLDAVCPFIFWKTVSLLEEKYCSFRVNRKKKTFKHLCVCEKVLWMCNYWAYWKSIFGVFNMKWWGRAEIEHNSQLHCI